MKKPFSIILYYFCLFLLPACSTGPSPESVLSQYLDAYYSGNHEQAYQLLSAEDQQVKSLGEYQGAEKENEFAEFAEYLQEQTSFKIKDMQVEGEQATATVDLKLPDLGAMMGDILSLAFQSAFSEEGGEPDEKEIEKMLEKYKGKNMPMTTETAAYRLRKEESGWKVFLDWKQEQLLEEARSLEESEKYSEALEKYQAAYERSPLDTALEGVIKSLEVKRAAALELEAYLSQVEIMELQAGYYDTYLDGRIPGVEFKLKNNGQRMLSRVEVTVFFKDDAGNTIYEQQYTPVNISPYSFSDDKPLKPGYIWRLERGKFLTAKECPEEWATGKVDAIVSKVGFAED